MFNGCPTSYHANVLQKFLELKLVQMRDTLTHLPNDETNPSQGLRIIDNKGGEALGADSVPSTATDTMDTHMTLQREQSILASLRATTSKVLYLWDLIRTIHFGRLVTSVGSVSESLTPSLSYTTRASTHISQPLDRPIGKDNFHVEAETLDELFDYIRCASISPGLIDSPNCRNILIKCMDAIKAEYKHPTHLLLMPSTGHLFHKIQPLLLEMSRQAHAASMELDNINSNENLLSYFDDDSNSDNDIPIINVPQYHSRAVQFSAANDMYATLSNVEESSGVSRNRGPLMCSGDDVKSSYIYFLDACYSIKAWALQGIELGEDTVRAERRKQEYLQETAMPGYKGGTYNERSEQYDVSDIYYTLENTAQTLYEDPASVFVGVNKEDISCFGDLEINSDEGTDNTIHAFPLPQVNQRLLAPAYFGAMRRHIIEVDKELTRLRGILDAMVEGSAARRKDNTVQNGSTLSSTIISSNLLERNVIQNLGKFEGDTDKGDIIDKEIEFIPPLAKFGLLLSTLKIYYVHSVTEDERRSVYFNFFRPLKTLRIKLSNEEALIEENRKAILMDVTKRYAEIQRGKVFDVKKKEHGEDAPPTQPHFHEPLNPYEFQMSSVPDSCSDPHFSSGTSAVIRSQKDPLYPLYTVEEKDALETSFTAFIATKDELLGFSSKIKREIVHINRTHGVISVPSGTGLPLRPRLSAPNSLDLGSEIREWGGWLLTLPRTVMRVLTCSPASNDPVLITAQEERRRVRETKSVTSNSTTVRSSSSHVGGPTSGPFSSTTHTAASLVSPFFFFKQYFILSLAQEMEHEATAIHVLLSQHEYPTLYPKCHRKYYEKEVPQTR